MADSPSPDADVGLDQESTNDTPRWVKVFGVIAIIVALLFVIMLVVGGGRHGPGRHRVSDSGSGAQTPPVAGTEIGRAPRGAVR
jgi:hypothetical protein